MVYSKYTKSEDGGIAITGALSMPFLLLLVFGALDYSQVSNAKQELESAASAAALAAVNEAHIAYSDREDVELADLIKEKATQVFQSRTSHINGITMEGVTISPAVSGNVMTVDINYGAKVDSLLSSMVGVDSFAISGQKRAQASAKSYININLLFDVSGSMGIGATIADQKKVFDATGCAFACHTGQARGGSSYDKARSAGADMRIDVAREAAMSAVNLIEQKSEFEGQVSFSLHKFSNTRTEILSSSDKKSTDYIHIRQLLSDEVQMDMVGTGTNVELAVQDLSKTLKSGSGRTPDDRVEYIIVLTDGIENSQAWSKSTGWYPHPEKMVNNPYKEHAKHEINYAPGTTSCKTLRDNGTHIYFIHTEYIVPSYGALSSHNVNRFDFIEDELHDLVPVRMTECTGKVENVIEANSPEEIENAFERLFKEFSTPLRLY